MYDREKEVREAIQAGYRALDALKDAEEYLNSAGRWGVFDMLGGGLVSSLVKHSKMDSAQESVERAHDELQNFSRELRDVQMYADIHVNFDGFTKFIDLFCDNFLVDVMVQSKISDTKRNVQETKEQVERAIVELQKMQ